MASDFVVANLTSSTDKASGERGTSTTILSIGTDRGNKLHGLCVSYGQGEPAVSNR